MSENIKQFIAYLRSLIVPDLSQSSIFARLSSQKEIQSMLVMSQTMSSMKSMDEILNFLVTEIHKFFGINCGILMLEEDQYFKVRSHRDFPVDWVKEFKIPLGKGAVGECFSTGKMFVLAKEKFAEYATLAPFLQKTNWKNVFIAPLIVDNHSLGVFLACSETNDFFNEKMTLAIEPFIKIVSLGIRNAQLTERIEKFNRRLEAEVSATTQELTRTNHRLIHRVRELKTLYEITLTANTSVSLEDIFETVASRVQDLFNVESVGFFINVSQRENWVDLVLNNPSFNLPKKARPKIHLNTDHYRECGPVLKKVMDAYTSGEIKVFQGTPVTLKDELPVSVGSESSEELKSIVFHSLIAVPLKTSQKILGVIVLANLLKDTSSLGSLIDSSDEFTEEEAQTLTLIALRVAASVENVQMSAELKKRLSDLSTLHEISEAFYATPVLEFVIGKVVKIILKSLPCDLCTFMFFDPMTGELVTHLNPMGLKTGYGAFHRISIKEDNIVSHQVFRQGKPQIIDDIQQANVSFHRHFDVEQNIRSMMFIPLKVEEEVIGVLRLGSSEKSFFNQDHLRLAELIADRVAVIIQILHANKELERLNKVKTEFVSMVSHELRTPLTAVKGFVDIVLNEEAGTLNEQQKKFLKIAHNSIERLTLIISDLLDISKIESGQLKLETRPVSLKRILQESAETYRSTIESKQINFSIDVSKDLPEVLADESRIKQVIDNLLSNAMKFTPPKGSIHISTDDMGDFILTSISDTGMGIKKENHERIFERFVQVDSSLTRQAGGTGLGLAISKSIVEMHGGRIWVESELGKGSTFRFLLPRQRNKRNSENHSKELGESDQISGSFMIPEEKKNKK